MLPIVGMFIGQQVYEGWGGVVRSPDISFCDTYYPSLFLIFVSIKFLLIHSCDFKCYSFGIPRDRDVSCYICKQVLSKYHTMTLEAYALSAP